VTLEQKRLLCWLLASAAGIAAALVALPAAFVGGHYVPVGNDAFYHARRILDLIADPSHLHQFDPLVHVPEGSTLIWPWGYDYFMSLLVRAGLALHVSADAMTILDHLPVLALPVGLALLLWICRQQNVGAFGTFVVLAAAALLPLNLGLFGIGTIDHHFAEQLFVLATIALAQAWLAKPDSTLRACLFGALLGAAPCIHNGLFVLQFPIVLTLFWAWANSRTVPRTSLAFAITAVVTTLVVASPSSAFREGAFQFYTLSWFHVYFAFCVGATCVFFSRIPFSRRNVIILIAGIVVVLLPVVGQLLLADRFLSVAVEGAEQISEVQSLWELAANRSLRTVTNDYSPLVLLLPATLGLCLYRVWKSHEARESLFWIASACGLPLLAVMIRFHVFGSFALVLPWVIVLGEQVAKGRLTQQNALLIQGLALVLACMPVLPYLKQMRVAGNDAYYALTYDAYPDLTRECANAPGVALSNPDDANYIRFHTSCGVIANNFLLTPFHEQKIREARALLNTPAAELPGKAPEVRYVFVHRQSLFQLTPDGRMQFLPGGDPSLPDPRLVSDLIDTPLEQLPPQYRLVKELAFERPRRVVFARVFAIEPTT
jgi:hypothetical protein